MNLIMQPNPNACGQACIAMITGKPVEEVIAMNKSTRHLILPLNDWKMEDNKRPLSLKLCLKKHGKVTNGQKSR